MTKTQIVKRLISFDPANYKIVVETAAKRGLGSKGRSAALNLIVSEWAEMKRHAPATQPAPEQQA